jgi:hypothetical protein
VIPDTAAIAMQDNLPSTASTDATARTLSLSGVVSTLQIVLAARRAARNEAHARWHRIIRGL